MDESKAVSTLRPRPTAHGQMSTAERRTRKDVLAQSLAVLGTSAVSTACGPLRGREPAPAAQQPVTLQYWTWGGSDVEPLQREDDIVQSWQPKYPHITIERARAAFDKVQIAIVGGTPPDLYFADFQQVNFLIKAGMVVDLKQRAARDKDFRLDEFHPKALEVFTDGGKTYGYPATHNAASTFYNGEHFKAAGLPSPYDLYKQGKWTWDAYIDAARKLTKIGPDGRPQQVGAGWNGGLFRLAVWSNGGLEFDDWRHPKQCLLDKPEAQEAIQMLVDLRWKHKAATGHPELALGQPDLNAFGQGLLSMHNLWGAGIGRPFAPGLQWGYVPHPKGRVRPQHATDYTTEAVTLLAASKWPDAGWTFIKWWNRDRVRWLIDNRRLGNVPARQPVVDDANRLWPGEHPEMYPEAFKYGKQRLAAVDQAEIWRIINPELAPMWNGQESVKTATAKGVQLANEFLRSKPQ